jgi:uncharacterized protein YjiS (DUF1127 family)
MTETESCDFVLEQAPVKTWAGPWNRLIAVLVRLDDCLEVRRQRRTLRMMDGHMLKDIGLTRADVEWEAARSFWDIGKQ